MRHHVHIGRHVAYKHVAGQRRLQHLVHVSCLGHERLLLVLLMLLMTLVVLMVVVTMLIRLSSTSATAVTI